MSPMLAILVYLAAIAVPIWLLYEFGGQSWYWHCLALAGGVGLGFLPIPPEMQGPAYDLAFGFTFIALLIWGAGGIIFYHAQGHHHGHARHA
ncbi:MAG: hypothetical protein KGN36_14780 [Acidobacteriota bacterium]|nr:hypothetical protein [Acidobacteriota bacterium]